MVTVSVSASGFLVMRVENSGGSHETCRQRVGQRPHRRHNIQRIITGHTGRGIWPFSHVPHLGAFRYCGRSGSDCPYALTSDSTFSDLAPLAIVAVGVVIGFPLLTALALQHITSARSVVFIGLLPLATAICGVIRGGERPRPAFWLFSGGGSLLVALYAWSQSADGTLAGDLLMLAAILVCGLGYAEGAVLTRRLGGWQVISWALVMAAPVMAALAAETLPSDWTRVTLPVWLGLGYVSVFSMWVGFLFWYRGLAIGGITGVGQLQLLQPFFGLLLAGVVLGEPVDWLMIALTLLVVACVAGAKRFA